MKETSSSKTNNAEMDPESSRERQRQEYETQAYGFSSDTVNRSISALVHESIARHAHSAKTSMGVSGEIWEPLVSDVAKHADSLVQQLQRELTEQWAVPPFLLLEEDQYTRAGEKDSTANRNDIIASRIAEETILHHMLQEAQEVRDVLEQAERAHGCINKILQALNDDCGKLTEKLNLVLPQ